MDPAALIQSVQAAVPGVQLEAAASVDLQPTVYASVGDVTALMQALRNGDGLRFDFLAELTAADFWPREPRFELIYVLVSTELTQRLRVKVRLPGADPHAASVSSIWPGANWLEREVWDLFGIAFDGHPDPRRLLMPEDWEGFPLRKDYPVQIRMTPRTTEALQVTEQQFRDNVAKDRLARK
jgi:NADH-quinone oxidoreductase subunit C